MTCTSQYPGAHCGGIGTAASSGPLPFTGTQVAFWIGFAVGIIVLGIIIRHWAPRA